jgi:hypothetical protein
MEPHLPPYAGVWKTEQQIALNAMVLVITWLNTIRGMLNAYREVSPIHATGWRNEGIQRTMNKETAKPKSKPSLAINQTASKLVIATINVNGLLGKLDQIKLSIGAYELDVVCIQETKLCAAHLSQSLKIEDFDLFRRDRNVHGGGVCIYVRALLHAASITCPTNSEITAVSLPGRMTAIFCVYKPPTTNPAHFYGDVADAVTPHLTPATTIIIAGDTNMDALDVLKKKKIDQFCQEVNAHNWISAPTHRDSCIDHIMVTKGVAVRNVKILPPIEKWHSVTLCEVSVPQLQRKKANPKPQTILIWRKANWLGMEKWLQNQNLKEELDKSTSIEDSWQVFKSCCINAVMTFVPQRPVSKKKSQWITKETLRSLHKRDKWFTRWRKSQSATDRARFEKARKACRKLLTKDKRAWVLRAFGTSDVNKFWRAVKNITKPDRASLPDLSTGCQSATSDPEKAELLRLQYEKVWTADPPPPSLEYGPNDYVKCEDTWAYDQLRRLNPNKATGPDGIPPHFLKKMASVLSPALAALITLSWREATVPLDWKTAVVVPKPKKAGSPCPSDYRPISLTCVACKIAERFVLSQIIGAIDVGLPPRQYGFRKGRGTTHALMNAEHAILTALEDCSGVPSRAAVVSFDIAKAFDSVSYPRLFEHLNNSFNLPLNAKRWLHDFLINRNQRVRVGNAFSKPSTATSGVPQGTVLGPILYNAATAWLKDLKLSEGAVTILFADDLLYVKRLASADDEKCMQEDCDTIFHNYQQESLLINGGKTALLLASLSPTGALPLQAPLSVGGIQVTQVDSLKYLGVLFDDRLTFTKHAIATSAKARRMLGAVGGVLRKWHLSKELQKIYTCCIRPVVAYACAVAYPRTAEGRSIVEKVNKLAARLVLNDYDTDYEALLERLKWESIAWSSVREQMRIMRYHVTMLSSNAEGYTLLDWIGPEEARRAARLSNSLPYKVAGKAPRLMRTKESASAQTVKRWNCLPDNVINLSQISHFMDAISTAEVRQLLLSHP